MTSRFDFAAHALVTIAQLSQFIWGVDDASDPTATGTGLPLSDGQCKQINILVNGISRQIMNYIDMDVKRATYVEVWDGAASDELVPTMRPLIPPLAADAVRFALNGDFTAGSPILSSTAVFCDRSSIKFRLGVQTPFARGAIQVTYNAGYDEVPDDIVMATLLQFQYGLKQVGRGDSMVGLKTIGKMGETQTKDSALADFGIRGEVKGLLETYRRFDAPLSIMFARVN